MKFIPKYVSAREEKIFAFLGFIFTILTLFLSFLFLYSYFFERKCFINRIRLYKYLKSNKLGNHSKFKDNFTSNERLTNYKFILNDFQQDINYHYTLIYWLKNKKYDIIDNSNEIILGWFIGDLVSKYYDKKILKILNDIINEREI